MIRWKCPSCAIALRAKDADAGRKTQCPHCSAVVSIPQSSDGTANEFDVELIPTDAIQEKSKASPQGISSAREVFCPHCALAIVNDQSFAGRIVECPHCHGTLRMPGTLLNNPPPRIPIPHPTIAFRCPHCQSPQTFSLEFAGPVIKCAACNSPVQIPVPQGQILGGNITANLPAPALHQTVSNSKPNFDFISTESEKCQIEHATMGGFRRNRGNGIVAMTLGLLSLFFCLMAGLFAIIGGVKALNGDVAMILGLITLFFCVILGPFAITVGSKAIEEDPYDGYAKAGYVCGWIGTAILMFAVAGFCFYFFLVIGLVSGLR